MERSTSETGWLFCANITQGIASMGTLYSRTRAPVLGQFAGDINFPLLNIQSTSNIFERRVHDSIALPVFKLPKVPSVSTRIFKGHTE